MRTPETIALLVFLIGVVGVYVTAVSMLIRAVIRKIRNRPGISKPARWARRIVMTLAGLGMVCMAYGYWIEPYWPEVTRVRIRTDKISQASRPIRIVQISDLHSDPAVRLEERLPDIIAAEKPDAIVFTGDALNSPAGLENFQRCMRRLADIAPVYVVTGNWARYLPELDLFSGTGVTLLDNQAVRLEAAGASIWIAGVGVYTENFQKALADVPEEEFCLLAYHLPDAAREIDLTKVDLFCAGHTHGGQSALPIWGAIVTLTKYGDYAGEYRHGDTLLYVNRGIGMEGGRAPRVRFLSRPEITVFEIGP